MITKKIVKKKTKQQIAEMEFNKLFEDGKLNAYVEQKTCDPWKDTIWKGYKLLGTYQKGQYGEDVIERLLTNKGLKVTKGPEWKARGPFDRLVNNIKTEFKFSLSHTNDNNEIENSCWAINHLAAHKDWERLVFLGINKNAENILVLFTKSDWLKHIDSNRCLFGKQQSGKKGGNDDYMCTANNIQKLLKLPFVKKISEW